MCLYAVADGHGPLGHLVSHLIVENLLFIWSVINPNSMLLFLRTHVDALRIMAPISYSKDGLLNLQMLTIFHLKVILF